MRINILVNQITDGWEPDDLFLGGSEEAVHEWAKQLYKKGHEVYVYRNGHKNNGLEIYDGITYHQRGVYSGHGDICLNFKSYDIKPKEPTLYITNETDANLRDLSKYRAVIWPSRWAAANIPVNNNNIKIVPHSYDPEKIKPGIKIKDQCLYASSPDRGLEILMRAWPTIHKYFPDSSLKVTYGAPEYDIEGVEFLGKVSEEEMNELYAESEYWLYPCIGNELFCITGLKAQAAKCIPVVIPHMALSETIKSGYFATRDNFANKVIEAMNSDYQMPDLDLPTHEDSVNRLLQIINETLH